MAQTTRSRKATSPAPSKTAAAPRGKKESDVAQSPLKGAAKNAVKPARSAVKSTKGSRDVGLLQPQKPAPKSKASPKPTAKSSAKSPAKPSAKTPSAARPAKGKTPAKPASKASSKPAAAEAAPAYEVRSSAIHGLGLFATRRIPAEERIGVYQGPRSRKIDTYVLWVEDENGKEYGIDGQNEMRYVNHSKAPNAAFEGEELWTLRRIEPGEEITHHYGDEWED